MRSLEFHRVLGSGSFGTVYLADLIGARRFRRQIAVKVLLQQERGEDGQNFLTRVRDEARLLGLLQDESILKVLELTRVEGRDAVIMEYVEGVDLNELALAQERPPARALAEVGAAVAGALHRAHTAVHASTGQPLGVIHRDVKPANIMVSVRGGVKLLDFGVARARFEARESRTGQFMLGTLNYMAPEYIVTSEISTRADIYGLALTLWEIACGEVYGQPKIKEDQHRARLAERLARLPDEYQPLRRLLERMLAWNPLDRPDGAEVERALLAATDQLTGRGLRSWATEAVPRALTRRAPPQDTIGLAGRAVQINDESEGTTVAHLPEADAPAPAPAPAPDPQPAPPRPAPRRKRRRDWPMLLFQALLLGAGFGMVLLVMIGALLLLLRFAGKL